MVSKSDLATQVQKRVDGIPSAVSSSVIQDYIEYSHIEIENNVGDSFTTSDIPTKYQPILIDMAVVKVLEYMVNHSIFTGGTLNVIPTDVRAKKEEIQKRIDKAMNNLSRTYGITTTTEPEETVV